MFGLYLIVIFNNNKEKIITNNIMLDILNLGQMELCLTQTINTNFGYRTFVYSGNTLLEVARG